MKSFQLMTTCLTIVLILGGPNAIQAVDAPEKEVKLVPNKDLTDWQTKGERSRSQWTVGTAALDPNDSTKLVVKPQGSELINAGAHGVDIYSEAKFGDAVIELEVMVPKGSNSGIYIMGEYELQILDSYGREKLGMGDMGAIYSVAVPTKNASKAPGQWQKYVIKYHAPRFDADGKKTANGRIISVVLNDEVIHSDLELKGPTPGGVTGKEAPTGPLMFQGDHGEVAYRNIRITQLAPDTK